MKAINLPRNKIVEINGKQTRYKAITFGELRTVINELDKLTSVSDDDIVIFSSLNPDSIIVDNGVVEFSKPCRINFS